jgi:hypothetical protein
MLCENQSVSSKYSHSVPGTCSLRRVSSQKQLAYALMELANRRFYADVRHTRPIDADSTLQMISPRVLKYLVLIMSPIFAPLLFVQDVPFLRCARFPLSLPYRSRSRVCLSCVSLCFLTREIQTRPDRHLSVRARQWYVQRNVYLLSTHVRIHQTPM